MELNPEYRFERISRENIRDFINLHRDIFKRKFTKGFLKAKFNTAVFSGVEYIGYLVYHVNGEPVSYFGVYPMNASLAGKKILVAQAADTMTKPDHRALGLFISSAEKTNELCSQYFIKGIFGFPSPSAYRTYVKKLGWKFADDLKKYSFPVPIIPLSYIPEKISFLKPLYLAWVRLVLGFYPKSGFFEGSVTANGQDGVLREKSFWDYKMSSPDKFAIRLGGADIIIKTNGNLSIGDINIRPETNIAPVLKNLKILSFLTFNPHLVFIVSPGTVLDEKLGRIKAGTRGLPVGFKNLSEDCDLSTIKFTWFDFDTF